MALPVEKLIPESLLPHLRRDRRPTLVLAYAAAQAAVLAPVRHDPRATWQPRRRLVGLPALVDEDDLAAWLPWATPGVEVAYFAGESLVAARAEDLALNRLARALLCRASTQWPIVTPPPCGHVRGLVTGSSDVELVQRRLGPSNWLYLARRR